MDGGTAISWMVTAGILGPLAYWVWRWMAGLGRSQASGAVCGGCAARATCGCALAAARTSGAEQAADLDTLRETVLYVSDLTEANAARLRAALLALEGVEAAAARPATGTMQVSYRPARLSPSDLASALEKVEREAKQPIA